MIDLLGFREANKIKQKTLADYLGVSTPFLSQVENHKRDLPQNQLSRLLNNDMGWDTELLTETGTVIQKIGDGSNNNTQVAGASDVVILRERVKYLERILEEKERLINVLMEKQ